MSERHILNRLNHMNHMNRLSRQSHGRAGQVLFLCILWIILAITPLMSQNSETSKVQTPQTQTSQTQSSQTQTPQTQTSQTQSSQTQTTQTQTSQTQSSQTETPQTQPSQTQPSLGEAPQGEGSQGPVQNESFPDGETPPKKTLPEMPQIPSSDTFSFIKSMMALCFVLGLIFLAAYLFKRFSGIRTPGFGRNRVPIHLVGSMTLGEKRFLTVVQVQDKHFFLGVTPDSISMLSELQIDLPEMPDNESGQGFEAFLLKARTLLHKNSEKK